MSGAGFAAAALFPFFGGLMTTTPSLGAAPLPFASCFCSAATVALRLAFLALSRWTCDGDDAAPASSANAAAAAAAALAEATRAEAAKFAAAVREAAAKQAQTESLLSAAKKEAAMAEKAAQARRLAHVPAEDVRTAFEARVCSLVEEVPPPTVVTQWHTVMPPQGRTPFD